MSRLYALSGARLSLFLAGGVFPFRYNLGGKIVGGSKLLTRGHLIGQIVDDLAGIAAQAKQRARLHLFDIHTHVEDFAKEVLNRVLRMNLLNLNAERLNNPGLDLGDTISGWAFQITGDKSGAKVKATLEAIGESQRNAYPNIRVLVIGEKQSSYSFNGEPFARFQFTPEKVWDFNDVCSRIMSLSIEELSDLAKYVSSETRRVRVELEVPDEDGHFPTNIDDLIEAIPKPRISNGSKMVAHFNSQEQHVDPAEVEKAIKELGAKLIRLPRLTREVFRFLVERRDEQTAGMTDDFRIADPKLRRIYRGDDLRGDLALLEEAGLVDFNEPDEPTGAPYWRLYFPGRDHAFHQFLVDYLTAKKLDLRKPLVAVDFSDF